MILKFDEQKKLILKRNEIFFWNWMKKGIETLLIEFDFEISLKISYLETLLKYVDIRNFIRLH